MQCHRHPEVGATGTCTGCAEPFCPSCLVAVRGGTYCASCKQLAVAGVVPQTVAICKEAKTALTLAFVGVIFCGVILGPLAIARASSARRQIEANPSLGGKGHANAATAVGIVVLVYFVIGVIATGARGLR